MSPRRSAQYIIKAALGNVVVGVHADNAKASANGGMDRPAQGGGGGDRFLRFEDQGVVGDEKLAVGLQCGLDNGGCCIQCNHDARDLRRRVTHLEPRVIP